MSDDVLSPVWVSRVRAAVDRHRGELVDLARRLAAEPELAYEEFASSQRCAEIAARHGLEVTHPAYGLATAFTATAGPRTGPDGRRLPHLVFCAEYDALPEVGQACGHHLIAATALGAGLVLAELADDLGVRVTVLGTPAEETGGGKIDLLAAGAFDDADAALMVHPSPYDDYGPQALAIVEWQVSVHGRTAHASSEPHLGRNALDGLIAGYVAIGLLRQHLRNHQQVHGIITHGGAAPNIVPDHTEAMYYLRAASVDDLDDLMQRVRAALEGAATATGTTVTITQHGHAYEPLRPHPGLVTAFTAACQALGRRAVEPEPQRISGSTDFGNVSQRLPGLHAEMSVHSWPISNHQAEFVAHCLAEPGIQMLLDAVAALVLTAVQIGRDPAVLAHSTET